jgi:hypothetical protein
VLYDGIGKGPWNIYAKAPATWKRMENGGDAGYSLSSMRRE